MKKIIALSTVAVLLFSVAFADVNTPAQNLSLNFKEAYQLAVKNSVDMKVAELTIEADMMAYDEAKEDQSQARSEKDFYTTLESKYLLNGYALKGAEVALNASKRGKIVTERALELSFYSAYYGVALAQENQGIEVKKVARMKDLNDTVQLKLKLGLATKNEADASLVNYNKALNDLKNAELDLTIAKLQLNQALTVPLDSKVILKDTLKSESLVVKPLQDALKLGELNRIDVYLKAESKALATLKFSITENFYISKTVSVLKKAEIEKLKSENEYTESVELAKIAITQAYNNMLKAQNGYESAMNGLNVLQNNYNTTLKMYDLGMVASSKVAEVAEALSDLEYTSKQVLLQKNLAEKAYVLSYEVGGK